MTARVITLAISILALAGLLVLTRQAGAEDAPVYLLSWGSQGAGPGQFLVPAGLGLDGSGNVYVADAGNARIEIFSPSGSLVRELAMPVDSIGQPADCRDVAVDAAGRIYVTDLLHQVILVFNDNLQLINQWSTTIDEGPEALALDPSGQNIYVRNDSGNLVTFTTSGVQIASWWTGTFAPYSLGFGVAANGTLYLRHLSFEVNAYSPSGSLLDTFGSEGLMPGHFSTVEGIVASADGFVYVSDANARIEKFTAQGGFVLEWGTNGNGPDQFSTSLPDLVIDASNNIYILDAGNHRIAKYGPTKTPTHRTTWGGLKQLYR